jgi:hypothetical protein
MERGRRWIGVRIAVVVMAAAGCGPTRAPDDADAGTDAGDPGRAGDAGRAVTCDQSSASGSVAPVPIDDLVDATVAAACGALARCGLLSDPQLCSALLEPVPVGFDSLPASIAAVKAGKATYDAVRARQFVQAVAAAPCETLAPVIPPTCHGVFAGTAPDGSPCVAEAECLAGSFCLRPTAGSACAGTCTHDSTRCKFDSDCAAGQACELAPNATPMGAGNCVTPVPPGVANQPCGTGRTCAAGLACVLADDQQSEICLPRVASGESCEVSGQCPGLYSSVCDPNSHKCVDLPRSGPCLGAQQICNALTSYCDRTAPVPTCVPYLPLGSACTAGSAGCDLHARCQPDPADGPGTCVMTGATACQP